MSLDVCICTHNPRRTIFDRVLRALARQTLNKDEFRVVIVDNSSAPPIDQSDVAPLEQGGIRHAIIREPRLGNVYARETAIRKTDAPWVVFVDDDNELCDDYLATVAEITRQNPRLGCFGGKLLPASGLRIKRWMRPLLRYLAIKDPGDEVVSRCADAWGIWEPPTAGAAVRRAVLDRYLERLEQTPQAARLGRKGRLGLHSGEDSLMMRGAYDLHLECSYQPRLKLWHHIDPSRFRFWYLLRLVYSFGRSHVILERSLGKEIAPARRRGFVRLLARVPTSRNKVCLLAWTWGYFIESRAVLQGGGREARADRSTANARYRTVE